MRLLLPDLPLDPAWPLHLLDLRHIPAHLHDVRQTCPQLLLVQNYQAAGDVFDDSFVLFHGDTVVVGAALKSIE